MKVEEIIKQIKERKRKFRAWDTQTKRMLYNIMPLPNGDGIIEFYPDGGFDELIGSHFIPLEYTGLKDKHGKEIYEGDIVLVKDVLRPTGFDRYYHDVKYIVVKQYGKWYLKIIRDFKQADWFSEEELWDAYEHCEVVGNIFENPELAGDD